jgi:hypothetical protein
MIAPAGEARDRAELDGSSPFGLKDTVSPATLTRSCEACRLLADDDVFRCSMDVCLDRPSLAGVDCGVRPRDVSLDNGSNRVSFEFFLGAMVGFERH